MSIYSSPVKTAFFAALLAAYFAAPLAKADDTLTTEVLEPGFGKSFVVGSKTAVTFFQKNAGACDLTIMVGELRPNKESGYVSASRLLVTLAPGASTSFDSAEGKSLNFECSRGASSMKVNGFSRAQS